MAVQANSTMRIFALTDSVTKFETLNEAFQTHVVLGFPPLNQRTDHLEHAAVIVDLDLRQIDCINQIKSASKMLMRARSRLFLVDKGSRVSVAQAYSLGASMVTSDVAGLVAFVDRLQASPQPALDSPMATSTIAAALGRIFDGVSNHTPLHLADAEHSTTLAIEPVRQFGLTTWLQEVRRHHEGTFQHCLLVTGIAIDFGLSLGLSSADIHRLGMAATLHDVGKGSIPTAILDKPGRLDEVERAVVETHPRLGYEALKPIKGIPTDVLDAVLHHHEFLDGTGYPDQLRGDQISDLVRILTIADIFGALIEERSYKPPMSRAEAYQIICGMEGRLERALLLAFRDVALFR